MAILVTGGAGFIGSHTCVELQESGYDVVVLDNLCNSSEKSLERVEAITGKKVTFYKGDILDRDILGKMEFRPAIAPRLKTMDSRLFRSEKMNLSLENV